SAGASARLLKSKQQKAIRFASTPCSIASSTRPEAGRVGKTGSQDASLWMMERLCAVKDRACQYPQAAVSCSNYPEVAASAILRGVRQPTLSAICTTVTSRQRTRKRPIENKE